MSSNNVEREELISVIIPVYKAEKYINKCIESVVSQTYTNIEIILIDDGSPDRCPEICDSWALKDSRIRVIHKPNAGQAMARNTGLEIARGQYIGFMDDDDWISPNMYEVLLTNLIKYNADYAQTTVMLSYKDKEVPAVPTLEAQLWEGSTEDAFFMLFTGITGPVVWDKLYKRELFDGVFFPDQILGDDIPISCEVFRRTKHFVLDARSSLYHYRQVASSQSRTGKISTYYAECSRKILNEMQNDYPNIVPYATVYHMKNLVWAYEQIIRNGNGNDWNNFKRIAEKEIREGLKTVQKDLNKTAMPVSLPSRLRWWLIAYCPLIFPPLYLTFSFFRKISLIRHYV